MILPDHLQKQVNESDFWWKVRLCNAKLNRELDIDWSEIVELLDLGISKDHLRKVSYGYKEIYEHKDELLGETEDQRLANSKYKETVEIKGDGTHHSDKLLRMSAEQAKDPDYLLAAHGYDSKEWELTSSRSNIWNVYSKQDGVQVLFSSKIVARPKVNGFDFDAFLERANAKIKPTYKHTVTNDGNDLLEIPLYDLHFGVNTYEYYKPSLDEIIAKITSKKWDKIFFIIGQDLLHNNGFDGKTSSGTQIQTVNMNDAWEDAYKFYCELITVAQENSNSVDGSYSIANHDDSMAWAFVKCLEIKFPDINFDTSKKVRKAFTWNDVFIGYTHGHKGANRLHENFLSDFGKQMALASIVEIHSGHLHTEKARDKFGVLVRTLSARGQTDEWHDDNGFVGAHKRFQLFEYSKNALKSIYYI